MGFPLLATADGVDDFNLITFIQLLRSV